MSELAIEARAKVNLHLRVVGKRADGYHDLVTLFDRISLSDRLVLREAGRGVSLSVDGPVPPGPENLAWRGASAALEAAGSSKGVELRLVKGVPAGAGLGGGSADCAAALVGTDRLLSLGLGESKLLALGRALGADVPFFVKGLLSGNDRFMAVGKGVGEVLEEVPAPPPLVYLLMNPGFEVSTAWVFQEGRFRLTPAEATGEIVSRGIDGVVPRTREEVLGLLRNDLEQITAARHPEIGASLRDLLSVGALGARMSGSGPTVFGLFATVGEAQRARDEIERRLVGTKGRVFVAEGA